MLQLKTDFSDASLGDWGIFKKKFLIGLRKLILKCGISKRIQSAIEG